jgi:hypothetical protein
VPRKDGTSEVQMIGGTPEEQAEALARLEAEEAKAKVLMEELRPVLNELFAHLPEEERRRVFDSPERIRLALNTLADNQPVKPNWLIHERWAKYKALLDELLPPTQETKGSLPDAGPQAGGVKRLEIVADNM